MIITDLRYKDNAFIQYTQAMSGVNLLNNSLCTPLSYIHPLNEL
jgi:hypothetical protein